MCDVATASGNITSDRLISFSLRSYMGFLGFSPSSWGPFHRQQERPFVRKLADIDVVRGSLGRHVQGGRVASFFPKLRQGSLCF